MKYEFLAKSSGTEPYQVTFNFSEDKLTVTCNCKAGVFGKLCKHKLALLTGDPSMLAIPEEHALMKELVTHVSATAYPQLLEQIHADELLVDEAKRALVKSKKALEKAMKPRV